MNKCLYCGKPVNNKVCNASCQLKYEYKVGIRNKNTITRNANKTLREKGQYTRDNTYLTERSPARTIEARRKNSESKQGSKNPMFGKIPWNKMFPTKKWYAEREFIKLRKLCLERDNYKCVKCKISQSAKNLYCDHIVPYRICKGHNLENLQMLCGSCHSKKSAIDTKLMKKMGYI